MIIFLHSAGQHGKQGSMASSAQDCLPGHTCEMSNKWCVLLRRRVKCFYAGVRWGLTLAPEALASRHALATSLTAAFSQVWHSSFCHKLLSICIRRTRSVPKGPAPDLHAAAAGQWQGVVGT